MLGAAAQQQAGPRAACSSAWLVSCPPAPSTCRGRATAARPDERRRPGPRPARASADGAFGNSFRKSLDRALISLADKLEQELMGEIPLGQQMAAQLEASQQRLAAGMAAAFGDADGAPGLGFMQAYHELQTAYHNYTVQLNARDPGVSPMSLSLQPADFLPDALHIITLFSQAGEGVSLVDLAARQLGPQDSAAEQYLKAVVGATLHAGSSVSLPAVALPGAALATAGARVAQITARLGEAYAQGGQAREALQALHWRLYAGLHLAQVRALGALWPASPPVLEAMCCCWRWRRAEC
jgi:hypothetical protein